MKRVNVGIICAAAMYSIGWGAPPAAPQPSPAAVKLANDFAAAVTAEDWDKVGKFVDTETIAERSEKGMSASREYAEMFKKSVAPALRQSLVSALTGAIKAGSKYKLVRVKQADGKTTAIYRLMGEQFGVDYVAWEIGSGPNGELKFVDQYDIIKGDWASHLLHKYYVIGVATEDKGNGAIVDTGAKEIVDAMPTVTKLTKDAQSGDYAAAIADYKALPTSLKRDKGCLIFRISAADHLKSEAPEEYTAAVADFEKFYPNDPALELLAMDRWVQDKTFARAHLAIDRIAAFAGEDGHMQYLHGTTWLASGTAADLAKAIESFKKAVAIEPDLAEGYWGLVKTYLKQQDYAKVAAELTEIEKKLDLVIGDLAANELYAGFVKSDEYKKWLAAREAAKPAEKQ